MARGSNTGQVRQNEMMSALTVLSFAFHLTWDERLGAKI